MTQIYNVNKIKIIDKIIIKNNNQNNYQEKIKIYQENNQN